MQKYKLYSLITILIWSAAYIFTKIGLRYYSPLGLSVFRYIVASVFFLLVVILKKAPLPAMRDIPLFFALGATGFSVYVLTFNIGAESVSVATSSIIIATVPVFTVLGALAIYKEKINKIGWIAILVQFLGVIIICLWDGVFSLNIGILWILVSALSFTAYNILLKKVANKYTPLQATAYSIFAGTILLLPFLPNTLPELNNTVWQAGASVIVMGVVCSGIGFLLWSKALYLADKTSDVSNYLFLSPLITTLIGILALAEMPSIGTWIGGALITAGTLVFDRMQMKSSRQIDKI